jgi:hypothetical protein
MGKFKEWRDKCLAILDNGSVVPCSDQSEWVEWMREDSLGAGNHLIAEDVVQGFYVVTEFLGINQNVSGTGPPLWFETMVFRESALNGLGVKIEYGNVRYSTLADALAGHAIICDKVKRMLPGHPWAG